VGDTAAGHSRPSIGGEYYTPTLRSALWHERERERERAHHGALQARVRKSQDRAQGAPAESAGSVRERGEAYFCKLSDKVNVSRRDLKDVHGRETLRKSERVDTLVFYDTKNGITDWQENDMFLVESDKKSWARLHIHIFFLRRRVGARPHCTALRGACAGEVRHCIGSTTLVLYAVIPRTNECIGPITWVLPHYHLESFL
jgi:hypothetical protein